MPFTNLCIALQPQCRRNTRAQTRQSSRPTLSFSTTTLATTRTKAAEQSPMVTQMGTPTAPMATVLARPRTRSVSDSACVCARVRLFERVNSCAGGVCVSIQPLPCPSRTHPHTFTPTHSNTPAHPHSLNRTANTRNNHLCARMRTQHTHECAFTHTTIAPSCSILCSIFSF